MCGIAGFVSKHPFLDRAALLSMREAIKHRGPDDAGQVLWDATGCRINDGPGCAGLAQRRLSIIDLSAAGHQPMSNESGDVWITYNGEFYNFGDYRNELALRHRFASNTDTETIIHLFEERGLEKTLQCINGMFAFALWDTRTRQLFLARDRLGKKPLYYLQRPDGSLLFASEMKALLASGLVDREKIDPAFLVQFWTYGYATGERTLYSQIRRLLPGHYAVWRDGELGLHEYWDCPFGESGSNSGGIDFLADELESLLSDAIRLRLVSDVPVGLFLSGGIDSSLIAALTAKITDREARSFTIGFGESSFDESGYAAEVAAHLKISNKVMRVTEDIQPNVETIARQFDEPFGDSSSIPTWFVAKLAREHVTVALTGDAGDELFAGYDAYAKALWLWGDKEQRKMFARRRPLLQRLVDMPMRNLRGTDRLTALEMIMRPDVVRSVLSERVWSEAGARPLAERERWYSRVESADLLSQLQYMNIKTYLPDDILVKVDRTSMAWGLECRCPFLDYRIVEFASRLPYYAKIDNLGRQKAILRRILSRYVPESLFERPKMGFSIPWAQWCDGQLGTELRIRWTEKANQYHRVDAAAKLFPRHKIGWSAWQWNAYTAMMFM